MNGKLEKGINIIEITIFTIIVLCLIYIVLYYRSNKEYKVTFVLNTDTTYAMQVIKKGDKLLLPDAPVKDNYTFIGWEYDGNLYDFEIPVESDMKLIAIWEYDGLK